MPTERPEAVSIPAEFFARVLPGIDDLVLLKIVLHAYQLSQAAESFGVRVEDLRKAAAGSIDSTGTNESAAQLVDRGIERAIAGELLVRRLLEGEAYLVPLAGRSRTAPAELPDRTAPDPLTDGPGRARRPNAFALYERHVGPLTPLVAEQIREAERAYPREWVGAAIAEAGAHERRNWRYVESILAAWEKRGGPTRH